MYDSMYGTWNDVADTPADVFRRNFWFCAIDDPSAYRQLDVIGAGNVMVESDYPHADSTWPRTQQMLREHLAGLPADDGRAHHLAQRERALPPRGARLRAARPERLLTPREPNDTRVI